MGASAPCGDQGGKSNEGNRPFAGSKNWQPTPDAVRTSLTWASTDSRQFLCMPLHPIRYHLNCIRFRAVVDPGRSARRAQMVTQAFTRTGTTRGSLSCRGRRHDELSAYVRTCYRVKRGPGSVQEMSVECHYHGMAVWVVRVVWKVVQQNGGPEHLMFLTAHWALMGLGSITTVGGAVGSHFFPRAETCASR